MKKLISSLLIAMGSFGASASVVTGDNVGIIFNPGIYSDSFTVGSGVDLNLSNFHFDLDTGVNGNEFLFTSTPQAGSMAGSSSFTLTDLDFTDGSTLTGFLLSSTSLANFSFSTTADSITFFYSNAVGDVGVVIDGTFVTTSTNQVPEPSSLALIGLGLAGMVAIRKRKA